MRSRLRELAGILLPLLFLMPLVALALMRNQPNDGKLPFSQLTFGGPAVSNQFPVASPDGRYILFQHCDTPEISTSPDGHKVYEFKEGDSNWDLYRMRLDGSHLLRLTDSLHAEEAPAWSPDSKTIAYRVFDKSIFSIWLMDTDGGNKRALVNDPGMQVKAPAFSPDGDRLAFYANRLGQKSWNVFSIELASRLMKQLTSGPFEDRHPQITPDGRDLVFHSDRGKRSIKARGHPKLMDVFSMKLDNGEIKQLTSANELCDDRHAFVSPNGKFIVYHSLKYLADPQHSGDYKKESDHIFIMTFDGAHRVNVTQGHDCYFKHPSWSADGRGIYCIFKNKPSGKKGGAEIASEWNVCYIDVTKKLNRLIDGKQEALATIKRQTANVTFGRHTSNLRPR